MPSIFDVLGPPPEPQGITGALRQGIGNMSETIGQFLPNLIMSEDEDMTFGESVLGGFLMGLGQPILEEDQRREDRRKMAAQLLPSLMPYMTPQARSDIASGLTGVQLDMQPQMTQQQEVQVQTLQAILSDPRAEVGAKMAAFKEIQKITGGDADVEKIFLPSIIDSALDLIRTRIIEGGVPFEKLDPDERDLIRMAGFDPTDPLVLARARSRGALRSLIDIQMDEIGAEILKKYSTWMEMPEASRPAMSEFFEPGEVEFLASRNLADNTNYAQLIASTKGALDAATMTGNPELIAYYSKMLEDLGRSASRRYGIGGEGARNVRDILDYEDFMTTAQRADPTLFERLGIQDAGDFIDAVTNYAAENEDFTMPSQAQLEEVAARVEDQFLRRYGLNEEDWETFKREMEFIRQDHDPTPMEEMEVASIINRRRWNSKIRGAPQTAARGVAAGAKAVGEAAGILSTGPLPSESEDGMTDFQRANREKVKQWWEGAKGYAKENLPNLTNPFRD